MLGIISVKEEMLKYVAKYFDRRYKIPKVGIYYPSVLSRSCLKDQFNYYYLSNLIGKIPESYLLEKLEGVLMHELIQSFKVWDDIEVAVSKRIKITSKETIIIKGRADAIKDNVVYEFKRTAYIPGKPRFKDLVQLNFYMEALGFARGVLVYIGRRNDRMDIIEYPWTLSDWHSNFIVNKAIELHTVLIHEEVPHCSCRNKRHDIEYLQAIQEYEKIKKQKKR